MYTIGHGMLSQEGFLDLLNDYSVNFLIDVRSTPYSKINPSFNKQALEIWVNRNGLIYSHFGDQLGGRPSDPDCYDETGKVKYEVIKNQKNFQWGLSRLHTAWKKKLSVALMCQEVHAKDCHRCKLIGRALSEQGIILQHIDHHGKLKDQPTAYLEATGGLSEVDLFGNTVRF